MRIVAALAAAALALVFAAERSPASTKFASEASARGTKFVSKRYGYDIVLSKAYDAFYAQSAWSGTFPDGLNPSVDTFVDWQEDRKFIVAAKRLSPGTTLGSWQTSMVARMQPTSNTAASDRVIFEAGRRAFRFISQ